MILSTDLISWLAYQQLIFQINAWLARAEVLSIDLLNKYLTGPNQSSVLWSFRYVMSNYYPLIFEINTALAWAKVMSFDLSDMWSRSIVNWYLRQILDLPEIKYCQLIFHRKTWLPINTWFATDSLLATYFIEEAKVLSNFSCCWKSEYAFRDIYFYVKRG